MISYLILHFNRPFLLEANIALVRKYAPKNTQIIIADDGSDKDVIEKIKKMPIDDLYVQKESNKNEIKSGTCSNTISSARKLVKNDFLVFSEDDFFLSGSPITSWKHLKNEEIMPRVKFNNCDYNIFEKSINLLKNNNSIKNVQIARDPLRVPVSKSFIFDEITWHYVNHEEKKGCYYCNWPNIMRTEDSFKCKYPKDTAIWSLEGAVASKYDAIFGKSNWAVVPQNRYYWHVGTAFSKRLNSFSKSKKRQVSAANVQEKAFKNTEIKDLESFNKMILNAWKKNYFTLDINELFEKGLNDAFTSAFERLNTYINKK